MNSIIDLNTAANITFNNQSAYAIAFGNSLGNITANIDNFTTNGVTKQVSITTLTDPVRDVLVDWQFSNVGVVTMAYDGPYANISLSQIAPATWRAYGIRSINQYDEAMANVKYTDISGGTAPNPDYNYLTVINDQEGNTRNWLTTLNVIANPTISITGNVQYAEDTLANVTIANIVVDPASTAVFRLFANVSAANGEVSNGVVTANSVSIDGTANSLNSQLAAAAIKFLPASDLTSNVANAINFNLVRSGNSVNTANANITCVATHNEYSLTTSYNYAEDQTVPMTFAITDLDTHATGYTVTFTQTSGATSGFYVNGMLGSYGSPAVISNSKANINVANISFFPYSDDTANIGLTFSQIKHLPTGNVTQASNVAISLVNTSSHAEYTWANTGSYTEDTRYSLGNTIADTDTRATSYTVSFTQTSGNIGQWYRNNVLVGYANTTLTISNSKANINNTVSWMPPIDYTGNATLTYSQTKVNVWGNTVTQASNVSQSITCGSTNPEVVNMIDRTVNANAVANIFSSTTPAISDGPDYGQNYTISLTSPYGQFGSNVSNAIASNTFSYTGNLTQVNNLFANIVFVPSYGQVAATGNFTYTQSRDGISQVSTVKVLTISANPVANTYTRTITGNSTWTPTQDQVLFGNIQLLIVAGGGAGHSGTSPNPGGGGGGGSIYDVNAVRGTPNALSQGTYNVIVGSGGTTNGQNGSNSYINLSGTNYFVAVGGGGGDETDGGGSYLNGSLQAGGTGATHSTRSDTAGGGGASPAGAGESAYQAGNVLNAGDGSNGYTSSISGNAIVYSGGGGGGVYDATGTPNPVPGIGGTGGGGNGSGLVGGGPAQNATSYGGGGGGGGSAGGHGTGYQGIVIIKIS